MISAIHFTEQTALHGGLSNCNKCSSRLMGTGVMIRRFSIDASIGMFLLVADTLDGCAFAVENV